MNKDSDSTPYLDFFPEFIQNQIRGKKSIQNIIVNILWLFSDRIFRMAVGVFIGAWVARYLGPKDFGILNYAVAFVGLFSAFSALGLNNIVVRELVRNNENKDQILGSAFLLRFIGGTATFILIFIISRYLVVSKQTTFTIILLLAAGLIFQSLEVIDNWFVSQVSSKYTVLARNISLVISSVLKVFLILKNASVVTFAAVIFGETLLLIIGLIYFYKFNGYSIRQWTPKMSIALILIKESWPLMFAGIAVAVYMKIDQIMLGRMVSDEAVGTYAAAVRLSEVWYFIPMAIASSVFPSIVKSKELSEKIYKKRMQMFYDLNSGLAYLLSIPFTFLAPFVIYVLYGSEYEGAGIILSIHIWASLFVFIGVARGQYLINEGFTKFAFIATLIGAVVNVVLNLLLIPSYHGIGAAISTVISQAFAAYFSGFLYRPLFDTAGMITKSFLIPFRLLIHATRVGNYS